MFPEKEEVGVREPSQILPILCICKNTRTRSAILKDNPLVATDTDFTFTNISEFGRKL